MRIPKYGIIEKERRLSASAFSGVQILFPSVFFTRWENPPFRPHPGSKATIFRGISLTPPLLNQQEAFNH